MDVPRKDANCRKWVRRGVVATVAVVVVPALTVMLARLKPAVPVVEASSVWPDTVKRGEMLRQVRCIGTLVAEDIVFVAAVTEGRVEKILVRPGTTVDADTVIVQLTSPELEQQTVDAEYEVKMSEARLRDLRVTLESQTLTQRADPAWLETDLTQARLNFALKETMSKEGLERPIPDKIAKANFEDLTKRHQIELERLKIRKDSVEAQLALQGADIDKLKAMAKLRASLLDALKVRSSVAGVLQELAGATVNTQLQVGQRVIAGTVLAKVVQPTKLKAELKIPETQIKDVQIGTRAQVDTRNGLVPGRVSRIDPAAKEGTVVVDVRLEGALPQGARPNLSVDGTVECEKLNNVMYVQRPAFGQPNSVVSIFKYDADGKGATRVQVKFGRHSVNTIEVLEGLSVGDRVILSDISAWDAHDRVRLN
ncbi:MAG: HlyD family efflux transporter periplasmic adaptor subunit [Acidobacteria bacterium]|nr:HlyD family efflux transporter periplasmic adaptor subunit [Acidobacteriota bacterium]